MMRWAPAFTGTVLFTFQGRGSRRLARYASTGASESPHVLPPFRLHDYLPKERLVFVDEENNLDTAAHMLSGSVLLGIDTETRPAFRKGEVHPTALLQVGTRDEQGTEYVLVFDLLTLGSGHASELNAVLGGPLADPRVIKVGLGIRDDIKDMARSYMGFRSLGNMPGCLELRSLHAQLTPTKKGQRPGLVAMVGTYLREKLGKGQQLSPWHQRPLSPAQLRYAASDAFVGMLIFDEILRQLHVKDPSFDVHKHTFTAKPVFGAEAVRLADEGRNLQRERIRLRRAAWGGTDATTGGA